MLTIFKDRERHAVVAWRSPIILGSTQALASDNRQILLKVEEIR